jgi:hypothetical protein
MGAQYQAANIRAPFGDGVNSTNVRRFTVDNASKSNALPAGWAGKYIYIHNETADVAVDFFFSTSASATIAAAPAATDAGAGSATQGGTVRGGAERHVRVPSCPDGVPMYFLRICGSTAVVKLELASD